MSTKESVDLADRLLQVIDGEDVILSGEAISRFLAIFISGIVDDYETMCMGIDAISGDAKNRSLYLRMFEQ